MECFLSSASFGGHHGTKHTKLIPRSFFSFYHYTRLDICIHLPGRTFNSATHCTEFFSALSLVSTRVMLLLSSCTSNVWFRPHVLWRHRGENRSTDETGVSESGIENNVLHSIKDINDTPLLLALQPAWDST
jgi:hypothetical protein